MVTIYVQAPQRQRLVTLSPHARGGAPLHWGIVQPVPIMNMLLAASLLVSAVTLSACAAVPPGSPAGVVSPTPVYIQPNHYDAPRGYWKK
jgi:hypothetical protein